MYQEAELRGFLTSEDILTGTLTDESTLHGILSSGIGAAGDYNNLINKPAINSYTLSGNKTAAQLGFADVSVSGSYNDLINRPSIPEKTSDLTNDSGFITSADVPTKTSELTNDSGFITSADVPTKTSDLTNDSGFITSADVPTKTSELTNDSGFITSADVPTKTSELTNDSGFITSADVPTKTSELTNDSGFITSADVPTKTSDLTNDSGFITAAAIPVYTSQLVNDSDFVASTDLATVATTGDYSDLINKPAIPTKTSDLTNDSGFITIASVPTKTSELTNDSGFITSAVTDNIIQAIQNAAACFSASGNIASFNTDIADKLFSCYVNVTAVQAGSGTPSPVNIRAISGWSECNLTRCGKNLAYTKINNVNIDSSGTIASSSYAVAIARVKQGVTYVATTDSDAPIVAAFYTSEPQIGSISYDGSRLVQSSMSFTSPIDGFVAFRLSSTSFNNYMLEIGNQATTYQAYNGTTHNIPFNQTVYGGLIDALSRVLIIAYGYVDLGAWDWTYEDAGVVRLTTAQSTLKLRGNGICNMYIGGAENTDGGIWVANSQAIPLIRIKDTAHFTSSSTPTDIKTFLTGGQAVFELYQPTTIQLTPTEVKTILGQNNIFADCGDIDLKYLETIGNLLT